MTEETKKEWKLPRGWTTKDDKPSDNKIDQQEKITIDEHGNFVKETKEELSFVPRREEFK